jgi:predicted metal-dependent hydrolase
MTTSPRHLTVSGLEVEVVRKAIKNLHLGVYPPEGRVRVAAPLAVSDAAVRVAVIGKLRWIRQQQAAFKHQPRETPREMVRAPTLGKNDPRSLRKNDPLE